MVRGKQASWYVEELPVQEDMRILAQISSVEVGDLGVPKISESNKTTVDAQAYVGGMRAIALLLRSSSFLSTGTPKKASQKCHRPSQRGDFTNSYSALSTHKESV